LNLKALNYLKGKFLVKNERIQGLILAAWFDSRIGKYGQIKKGLKIKKIIYLEIS